MAAPPVVGSLADLRTTRLRPFLTRAHLEHGEVFALRVLGRRIVVLAGLEANRFVSGAGRRHFSSHRAWAGIDGHFGVRKSLISSDGPEHTAFRRVEGRAYTRAHFVATLAGSAEVVAEELDAVRPGWLAVAPWCKRVVTEQVARAAVGGSVRAHLPELVAYIQRVLMVHVTRQRPAALLAWPSLRRARRTAWRLADELVAERRRTGPLAAPDLIDDVLAASVTDPERWGEHDIRLAVLGAFIAGMDTAANTMAFAIHELATHPELVPALVAEVDAAFADGVTPEALERLPGLVAFLFEVLRLHPIAPALERHLADDLTFAGHDLPAGTHVIVGSTVTHGLPALFADPARFDPGRFAPDRAEHKVAGAYVPFGVGPHTCAGRGMAEGLLTLNVALLLHRLRFTGDPAYTLRQVARPTPSPDDALRIRVLGRR